MLPLDHCDRHHHNHHHCVMLLLSEKKHRMEIDHVTQISTSISLVISQLLSECIVESRMLQYNWKVTGHCLFTISTLDFWFQSVWLKTLKIVTCCTKYSEYYHQFQTEMMIWPSVINLQHFSCQRVMWPSVTPFDTMLFIKRHVTNLGDIYLMNFSYLLAID